MVLGTRQKPAKSGGNREIREVQDCVVYVPILKTLERLLDVVTQVNTCIIVMIEHGQFIMSTDLQRTLKPTTWCNQ